jgi:phenylacetate-CoA ligase
MPGLTLRLYHALPGPVQELAAAARGAYLGWWRYSRETERLVAEAAVREHWLEARWRSWQEERIARMLHHAASRVAFYREQWSERRRRGDTRSVERLENWPILEKATVRRNGHALLADGHPRWSLYEDHTSGTTGSPLILWMTRKAVREWYALFEARVRRSYGVSREDRWAILGGQMIVPVNRSRPPFWVWNRPLHQLYLSAYHMNPEALPYYLQAIRAYRATYLLGYPSALATLARSAMRGRGAGLSLKVVITNAEPLYEHQRRLISDAFQCPVQETWGMAEAVGGANECPFASLHLWPDAGVTEFCTEEGQASPGDVGDIVCTGLLNPAMPLIRYRLGDRGAATRSSTPCRCGRLLPRLSGLDGRSDDLIYTRDGRVIGRLDTVFKSDLPVLEAQIVQETLDDFTIRCVPDETYSEAAERRLIGAFRERVGNVRVSVELLDRIPRTRGGKFRAVICNLPSNQRSSSAVPDETSVGR